MSSATTAEVRTMLPDFHGRIVEICGHACLSAAMFIVRDAQRMNQTVVWVSGANSYFFAPDASAMGVDLDRLPVVLLHDQSAVVRSIDHLLRSAAFDYVVVDCGADFDIDMAALGRFMRIAKRVNSACIVLTPEFSVGGGTADGIATSAPVHGGAAGITTSATVHGRLGALVSLRIRADWRQLTQTVYQCRWHAVKDRLRGAEWVYHQVWYAPPGLP